MLLTAGNYTAAGMTIDGVEIVRLTDEAHGMQVSIAIRLGNIAYEVSVKGNNIVNFPSSSVGEWAKKPRMVGIPLLAPWANRIDRGHFFANGRKYILNDELAGFHRDRNNYPIHGILMLSDKWELVGLSAGEDSASVTSRLEYWKYPEMMAQFPFAHTIEITHRLKDGVLEVETALLNHAAERMPVAIGFHPNFRVYDAPRPEWQIAIGARKHAMRTDEILPTGEVKPLALPVPYTLDKDVFLDDAFVDLIRDSQGRATFSLLGKQQKVSVHFGPKYPVGLVYATGRSSSVAIEPMAALTNAFNFEHEGGYSELQWVEPGGEWRESFWIAPSGF